MPGQFDEQSIRRIIRSVLDSERRVKSYQKPGRRERRYPYTYAVIAIAQVDEAGGVTGATAIFDVDNVVVMFGCFEDSTITDVENTIQGSWDDDAYVIVGWNGTDECWEAFGGGGGASDGKVRVNAADDLDYLEDQHYPVDTFDATYDLKLDTDTYADSGDDKILTFIDASAISGWSELGKQALIHDGATWKWMAIAECD